jgi:hypothetical protein
MEATIELANFDNIDFPAEQFIAKVDDEFNKFHHQHNYGQLVRDRGRNKEIKRFIEEILPLQKYLKFRLENGMITESIKWKNGNQSGDAILNTNEMIEITVAEHKNEYIIREHMNRGKPTFCAEGASKKNGITFSIPVAKSTESLISAHANMIINAINKKIKKYNQLDSLVIFLNQDGLLEESEFLAVIDNVKEIIPLNNINNTFIWSFQYQALINNNGIKLTVEHAVS